ncbi:hypothetical protein [Moellerella wisconsensis]|uniref:hypothetical protein n=1 Tax=Moellerella wisconsensis TaxID=158849 RepID=UPI0006415300|nr:hypothetical protein [Moellerella wisconsensis]KLN95756.1 hypothetical protein VK86_13660 [Moellerella wisconsensis]
MLYLGVIATDNDFLKNYNGITTSINNIRNEFKNRVHVVILFQTKNNNFLHKVNMRNFDDIIISDFFGTSASRNKLINDALSKQKSHDISHLLFHDSSIRWNKSASKFIALNLDRGFIPFAYSNISENEYFLSEDCSIESYTSKPKILTETYVGSYVFKIEDISNIRFNTNFGPGENTPFKSGEDVLFLMSYIKGNNIKKLNKSKYIFLHHPLRPKNFIKHLTYAKGQGKIYRILLSDNGGLYVWLMFFGFICNSILRCFLFKKNSFNILKNRFIGFWEKS